MLAAYSAALSVLPLYKALLDLEKRVSFNFEPHLFDGEPTTRPHSTMLAQSAGFWSRSGRTVVS
jgi:hypothetical protein